MKKIFNSVMCLLNIFVLCACSRVDYSGEPLEEMSLVELRNYNKDLQEEVNDLNDEYEKLYQVSDGLSKEEIISIINYVNNEVIKSNVMITSESKSFFNTSSVSSGSGTIVKEDEAYYYVLTNNHVIYALGNRTTYYVYDYLNNEYRASIMFYDANYDMALLKFNKGESVLRVNKLAPEDLEISKNVIAIGQPGGQRNAITFGEVLKYEKVECSDCQSNQSNINYECMYYSAITSNGNSGGMVVDYNYNLVAVVTFGMMDYSGGYMYGAGSPVSKVKEFFNNNNFEVGDYNE